MLPQIEAKVKRMHRPELKKFFLEDLPAELNRLATADAWHRRKGMDIGTAVDHTTLYVMPDEKLFDALDDNVKGMFEHLKERKVRDMRLDELPPCTR